MEEKHLIADIPQKAFIEHEGKVLMTLDRKGHWEPPGGRLHAGENPEEGLKRELREELSLEVEVGAVLHTFVFVSASGVAHYVVIFACTPLSQIAEMKMDEKELRELKWVSANDFEALQMKDGYKEALRKFFSK